MKTAMLAQAPDTAEPSAQDSMHNAVAAPPQPSQAAASAQQAAKPSPARTLNLTGPTQQKINSADQATDSWLMYNKGYMGQRYSALEQFLRAYEDESQGDNAEQQSFMDFYSDATLQIEDQTLTAEKAVDGPYQDQFSPFSGTPEFRFLGVVRYTFDLSGVDTKGKQGTLTFSDFSKRRCSDIIRFDRFK